MFDVDELIGASLVAAAEGEPQRAAREVLERAVRNPSAMAAALPTAEAGVTELHVSGALTVLNVVWAPGTSFPPHDHRMWAVIGVYAGQEDNTFYRRAGGGLVPTGGRALRDRDVLVLGHDAIHAVANPRRSLTAAVHVYGGDLFGTRRSQWDPATREERPYDVEEALARVASAGDRR
jgi:predicted metal-dependent enzyme (double-stranded beta helix superfamily)